MSYTEGKVQPASYQDNMIETGSLWYTQSLIEFYRLDKFIKGYNQPHLWGPANFIFNDKDRVQRIKQDHNENYLFYILDENLRNGQYRPKIDENLYPVKKDEEFDKLEEQSKEIIIRAIEEDFEKNKDHGVIAKMFEMKDEYLQTLDK